MKVESLVDFPHGDLLQMMVGSLADFLYEGLLLMMVGMQVSPFLNASLVVKYVGPLVFEM